jgi:hypothetical protein
MTNKDAAKILERLAVDLQWNISGETSAAIGKAITALEHQPEPQQSIIGLQCVCGWRTIDIYRLLCDSCGGHELKPVYEVSNNGQAKD